MTRRHTQVNTRERVVSTALVTRLYLSGVGVALGLSVVTLAFPQVPVPLMLGILGAIFLALSSWTHRHIQTHRDPGSRV